MTQQIDREGVFQGIITEYGLREKSETGTLAVAIKAQLDAMWNGEGWDDWKEFEMEASGFLYIIKKDGQPNTGQVESLVRHAGWDGALKSLIDGTWQPTPCQFTIKANEYQGKTDYRIDFINELNRVPGQMSNVTDDKLKALEAKFGAPLRAIAGSAKRNAAPAADAKMPKPKKAAPAPTPAKDALARAMGADPAAANESIPF